MDAEGRIGGALQPLEWFAQCQGEPRSLKSISARPPPVRRTSGARRPGGRAQGSPRGTRIIHAAGSARRAAARELRFPHPTQSKGRNKSVLPRRARDQQPAKTGRKTGGKLAPGAVHPATGPGFPRGMPQLGQVGRTPATRMYRWHCRIVLHVQGGRKRGLSARNLGHAKVAWQCCIDCARKLESDNMRVSRSSMRHGGYTSVAVRP